MSRFDSEFTGAVSGDLEYQFATTATYSRYEDGTSVACSVIVREVSVETMELDTRRVQVRRVEIMLRTGHGVTPAVHGVFTAGAVAFTVVDAPIVRADWYICNCVASDTGEVNPRRARQ